TRPRNEEKPLDDQNTPEHLKAPCIFPKRLAQLSCSCACEPDHVMLIPRTRRITQQHFGARRRARCRKNAQHLATPGKMSLPRRNQPRGKPCNPYFHSLCSETGTCLPTPQGSIGAYSMTPDKLHPHLILGPRW
ncbi:hypothetical protein GW17_00056515, partial [Ensete ventricosum]